MENSCLKAYLDESEIKEDFFPPKITFLAKKAGYVVCLGEFSWSLCLNCVL